MKQYITRLGITAVVLATITITSCSKDDDAEVTTAPGEAVLTAPENNKACEQVNDAGQVVFMWETSPNTESYDLLITNLETEASRNQYDLTTTSKAVMLSRGTPYSWQVISKNENGETATSDIWLLYVAGDGEVNYAPFPATAEAPGPDSSVNPTDGQVSLEWSGSDADGDDLTYTLQMDSVDGLQGNSIIENTTETSHTVDVESGTEYYWRVISSDGEHSSISPVYTFRT